MTMSVRSISEPFDSRFLLEEETKEAQEAKTITTDLDYPFFLREKGEI